MTDRRSRRHKPKAPSVSFHYVHAGKRLVRLGERKLGYIFRLKASGHWWMGEKLRRTLWETEVIEFEKLDSIETHIADCLADERAKREELA